MTGQHGQSGWTPVRSSDRQRAAGAGRGARRPTRTAVGAALCGTGRQPRTRPRTPPIACPLLVQSNPAGERGRRARTADADAGSRGGAGVGFAWMANVDEGLPAEMVRCDLAHRPSPSLALPAGVAPLRAAGSPPAEAASPACSSSASVRAPSAPATRLAAPTASPCRTPSCMLENDDSAASSASRRSRRPANATRAWSTTDSEAAEGSHIHVGMCASVPSGCRTTNTPLPRDCWRRTTSSRSPHNGEESRTPKSG